MDGADDALCQKCVDGEENRSSVVLFSFELTKEDDEETYPAPSKISAASTTLLLFGLKTHTIRIVHVTVLTIQKSKARSDKWNLWPFFELISCLAKWNAAPDMKKRRKTIVTGRSTFLFGIPPKMASFGAKGPLPVGRTSVTATPAASPNAATGVDPPFAPETEAFVAPAL